MLRNNNIVLSNENKIFKSQVVDSYLETTDYYFNYYITTTGLTEDNPLKIALVGTTKTDKITYTTDRTNYYQSINTGNSDIKPFFVYGNLESVTQYNMTISYGRETGNMIEFLNQFPNLEIFSIFSEFNEDLSYQSFPKKLKYLNINDTVVHGNINTIQKTESLEEIYIDNCDFSGDISTIEFSNLRKLKLYYNWYLDCDIKKLMDNNPNLDYLSINYITKMTGDVTNIDTSKLNYIYFYFYYNNNVGFIGDMSNWTFSSGLTYFYMRNSQSNYGKTCDYTNYDFSNTQCTQITIYGQSVYEYKLTGDLSNWELPDTLTLLQLMFLGITEIPSDMNTLTNFTMQYCDNVTSISGTTFYSGMTNFNIYNCTGVTDNFEDINLPDSITNLYVQTNYLMNCNIDQYTMPTNTITVSMSNNTLFTGYLSGITFNSKVVTFYIGTTSVYGNIVGWYLPPTLRTLQIHSTDLYIDFDEGTWNTSGLTSLTMSTVSGITGDLSNFIIGDFLQTLTWGGNSFGTSNISDLVIGTGMRTFNLTNCDIGGDLSNFDISTPTNLSTISINSCDNLTGDLTNWIPSGTTLFANLSIYNNDSLSGDTSNWNVNNAATLNLNTSNFNGRLKHNNAYYVYIYNSNISSNIAEDFNLSNRCRYFYGYDAALTGSLSGVTLYYSFYYFYVQNNSGLTGSDDFIDYIFINKKNFTYSAPRINISNIGDTVSGTEQLGDIGTWPSGNTYDLTEEQVNNLVDGTDYDGLGTNTVWTQAEKIYWMKYATISSTSSTRRYVNFQFTY